MIFQWGEHDRRTSPVTFAMVPWSSFSPLATLRNDNNFLYTIIHILGHTILFRIYYVTNFIPALPLVSIAGGGADRLKRCNPPLIWQQKGRSAQHPKWPCTVKIYLQKKQSQVVLKRNGNVLFYFIFCKLRGPNRMTNWGVLFLKYTSFCEFLTRLRVRFCDSADDRWNWKSPLKKTREEDMEWSIKFWKEITYEDSFCRPHRG